MITSKLSKLKNIFIEENKKGNEVTLLSNHESIYYELEEHISYVKSIEDYPNNPKMKKVTLSFKNMDLETVVYLDKDITVGSLVSTIGYCYIFDGKLNYSCKGGMIRIYQNIEEMAEIYRNRMYHMGITIGLSTVKEQKPYSTKSENIHKLEDSDFYYAIEEKGSRVINEIVNSIHRHQENKIDINSIPKEEIPEDVAI